MYSCCSEKCHATRYAPTGVTTHHGSAAWYQISAAQLPYSARTTSHVGSS